MNHRRIPSLLSFPPRSFPPALPGWAAGCLCALLATFVSQAAAETVWIDGLNLDTVVQEGGTATKKTSLGGQPLVIAGQTFARGFATHSESWLGLRLDGQARTFSAQVGIDDEVKGKPGGTSEFVVLGDGQKLWASGLMRTGDAAKTCVVPLAGVKLLELVVADGEDNNYYDHADWADAKIESDTPGSIATVARAVGEPYILTPPAPVTPRINGARVFGVRPGSPFLFTVPATGKRPMTFSAADLPAGLQIDATTGRITGVIATAGTYVVTLKAENAAGRTESKLRIECGERIALTPPMGWNSWNCFAQEVSAEKVKKAADSMVKTGLINHGWTYINVDDFWQRHRDSPDQTLAGEVRDAQGNIQPNVRFGDMKALADKIHGLGLKIGLYSSPGPWTCGGCAGSYGHEEQDAKAYAEWGFDYLKHDWCSYGGLTEGMAAADPKLPSVSWGKGTSDLAIAQKPYRLMGEFLRQQPRDIVYSLCQYGMSNVWEWGDSVNGNCWRTTNDIAGTWKSMSKIALAQDVAAPWAKPGNWNDPDMLILGHIGWGNPQPTRLTPDEQYLHFSLWCLFSAPLLIGCDMEKLDDFTLSLLTNDEVIALDQDPLGKQATCVDTVGEVRVYRKELEDGSVAVGFCNFGGKPAELKYDRFVRLGLAGRQQIRDLWRQQNLGVIDANGEGWPLAIPAHGIALLKFTAEAAGTGTVPTIIPESQTKLFPLGSVRLLAGSPFAEAVKANRAYVLALDPDRLLAPFRREAGMPPKAKPYGNWESGGLDGHTAGHYLSALANMIASGEDTPDGQLRRRLDAIVGEMQTIQDAFGDGYVGGVPGSRELWKAIAGGDVEAINKKWVPWYNVHKTFAGLRDAYLETGNTRARDVLVRLGDWSVKLTAHLSNEQMQRMLDQEHGGMNEVLADLYAITGDRKYLETAKLFNHHTVLDPLIRQEDRLTGKHANTQIPKVVGLERIATLTGDKAADAGARFFWETVTQHRSVAFGGNSVSEHFNDPHDFRGLLLHREGPETCNTYNMLRLTEQLFASAPNAAYGDYYERALYNHLLASINPTHPGYVYFTPIRPDHYRVYSVPGEGFWCCVGTGMENPGKYGQFIYAYARDGIYVNLFIASEVRDSSLGLTLRQDTLFPDRESSQLTLKLERPKTFTLQIRQPGWVASGTFALTVNGEPIAVTTAPSSYVAIRREWRDGDRVEIKLPMQTTIEALPDGSPWQAILRGPIVLAHPAGNWELTGLRADDSRMAHVASGPEVPLDQAPVLLADSKQIPSKVVADSAAGPLHFRLVDIVEPAAKDGLSLIPFFRLHDARYQMYWETTTREGLAARQQQLAAAEQARAAREAATLDSVSPGEQQPEVEHAYQGEETESGLYNGRHWRHGRAFQYTFNPKGEKSVLLSVTYSGSDSGRQFDIFANGTLIATQELVGEKVGEFVEKRYAIPVSVLTSATDGRVTIRFVAKKVLAGGVFDVRLLRADGPAPSPRTSP